MILAAYFKDLLPLCTQPHHACMYARIGMATRPAKRALQFIVVNSQPTFPTFGNPTIPVFNAMLMVLHLHIAAASLVLKKC